MKEFLFSIFSQRCAVLMEPGSSWILAQAPALFSWLTFCLAGPAKVPWTSLNSENCCKYCKVQVWNEVHGAPREAVNSELPITSGSHKQQAPVQWEMFLNWHPIIAAYFSIIFAPYLGPTTSLESLFVNWKAGHRNRDKNENIELEYTNIPAFWENSRKTSLVCWNSDLVGCELRKQFVEPRCLILIITSKVL